MKKSSNFTPTDQAAFRRGYLTSMAANGITPDILAESIEKQGVFDVSRPIGAVLGRIGSGPANLINSLFSTGKDVVDATTAGAVIAGGGIGIGGGYLSYKLRKMMDNRKYSTLEGGRNQEIQNALQQEVLRLKQRILRRRRMT